MRPLMPRSSVHAYRYVPADLNVRDREPDDLSEIA